MANDTIEERKANDAEAQNRTKRELETREDEARTPLQWKEASLLPLPESEDGFSFRWIRTTMAGETDARNVSARMREGWQPVDLKDHPEFQNEVFDLDSRWTKSGNVEIGGLLLCKMPDELIKSRQDFHTRKSNDQIAGVERDLLNVSDKMRVDRKSSFGARE